VAIGFFSIDAAAQGLAKKTSERWLSHPNAPWVWLDLVAFDASAMVCGLLGTETTQDWQVGQTFSQGHRARRHHSNELVSLEAEIPEVLFDGMPEFSNSHAPPLGPYRWSAPLWPASCSRTAAQDRQRTPSTHLNVPVS